MSARRPRQVAGRCAVALLGLGVLACQSATSPSGPPTALRNIVDPESVNAVSRFNSCVGHPFPQQDSPNSAKNYFWPTSTNVGTNDRLQVFAACDGTVRQTSSDTSADQQDRGRTIHLFCAASATSLRYFHLNFAPGLLDRQVRAGDALGYAALVGTGQAAATAWYYSSNFDVAVINGSDGNTENYFSRLSPDALSAWQARGITSVAQTASDPGQRCSSYNSDITNVGVLSFVPSR